MLDKRVAMMLVLSLLSWHLAASQYRQDSINQPARFGYRGFVGGMFIHTGYAYGGSFLPEGSSASIPIEGLIWGIGGKVAIAFGNHWRFGTEGYVTNVIYGDNREYTIGWGGLLADYQWHIDRWHPFVGMTIGGGGATNLCAIEKPLNDNTPQQTVWRHYGMFILNPFVGVEYQLTSKIRLATKLDWMLAPTVMKKGSDFSTGPRFYIGILFCK